MPLHSVFKYFFYNFVVNIEVYWPVVKRKMTCVNSAYRNVLSYYVLPKISINDYTYKHMTVKMNHVK